MFEYLMPMLLLRSHPETLVENACRELVRAQVRYGRRHGVPWGISESAFNVQDPHGTYQYKAFGVPGAGLKRGLAEDLVVAPYATALAAVVDPTAAAANFRRLANLDPYTLAIMHGSTYRGDGRKAILDLAGIIKEKLGVSGSAFRVSS